MTEETIRAAFEDFHADNEFVPLDQYKGKYLFTGTARAWKKWHELFTSFQAESLTKINALELEVRRLKSSQQFDSEVRQQLLHNR